MIDCIQFVFSLSSVQVQLAWRVSPPPEDPPSLFDQVITPTTQQYRSLPSNRIAYPNHESHLFAKWNIQHSLSQTADLHIRLALAPQSVTSPTSCIADPTNTVRFIFFSTTRSLRRLIYFVCDFGGSRFDERLTEANSSRHGRWNLLWQPAYHGEGQSL